MKTRSFSSSGITRTCTIFAVLSSLSVLTLFASPAPARADTPAVSFTGYSTLFSSGMIGYEFNVTAPVTVSALSVFDNLGDGLAQSHQVGLWDAGGTLLTSATVASGTTASLDSTGLFRYTTLNTPIVLTTGNGYRVAALFAAGSDPFAYSATGFSTAAGISHVKDRFQNSVSALTFPTSTQENNFGIGYFGGSFITSDGIAPGATAPEPGALSLFALGLPALGFVCSRRRKI